MSVQGRTQTSSGGETVLIALTRTTHAIQVTKVEVISESSLDGGAPIEVRRGTQLGRRAKLRLNPF